jgi:membrane-bound serine protease (ClpP class)
MSRTVAIAATLWACLVCLSAAPLLAAPATSPSNSKAVVIRITGEINDYTEDQLAKHLEHARQLGAGVVILQLDTYGGMVTSGLDMSAMLKNASDLHTIAYVPQKAISAGAMIALACDEIVMGPGAKLGDSAPISVASGGGMQAMPQTERAKIESPILEDFRDSALRHGYDPLLTEAMVSVGRTVYWVQNSAGQRKFVDQKDYDALTATGEWHVVPGVRSPIDPPNELLTVSTDLAVKLGLAKGVAANVDALAAERGLSIVATFSPSMGEEFLHVASSPPARFLLLVVFLMSLYTAMHIPGHGAPEAIALISFGLRVGVPWLTGYAPWWEVLIIVIGFALLAFEIFVIPGHGVSGLAGIGLMLFGFLMTFVPKEPSGLPGFLPTLQSTWSALQTGLEVIVGGLICSLFLGAWLRRYLPKLPFLNRLILSTPDGTPSTLPATDETAWPRAGDRGRAVTDLKPGGSAQFADPAAGDERIVSVVSDRGYVAAGTEVIAQETGGGRVVVRPA